MKTAKEWIELHRNCERRLVTEKDIKIIQEDARKDLLEAEHELSDAYIRLRKLIGMKAFETPFAPTSKQIYEAVEKALKEKMDRLKSLEFVK